MVWIPPRHISRIVAVSYLSRNGDLACRCPIIRPAITVPHIGTEGHIWTDFCRFFSIRDSVTGRGITGIYNLLNFQELLALPAGTCLAERVRQGYDPMSS